MRLNLRRWVVVSLAVIVVAVCVFSVWIRTVKVQEETSPDYFDFGTVYAGSTVEFSARFLTSANKHPFEASFERFVKRLPASWEPTLDKFHPKHRRSAGPASLIDLDAVKPTVETTSAIQFDRFSSSQRTNWYGGHPFVVAFLRLDTSVPGTFEEKVTITLGERRASLPVRFKVRTTPVGTPRLLIASTPFTADSIDSGAVFHETTQLLSSLPLQIDLMHVLPEKLGAYQTILLAGSCLTGLSQKNLSLLQEFNLRGGRLVFACNAFMRGSVAKANQVVGAGGLDIIDKDFAGLTDITNFVADPLTAQVKRLQFHRPSLVRTTDPLKARVVVPARLGEGGLVAVSRQSGRGDMAVLTSSLWWHWMYRFKTNSDNAVLMRNLLLPRADEPR